MNKKRKILLGVTSLVLLAAATALPITLASAAPQKIYDLTVAPTALQPGTAGQTLTATFKNATPSGNSTINSLKLFAAGPSGFTITAATGIGTETVRPGGQSVWVSNIPSVKPGKTYVLTLTVTTPAATDCNGSDVVWTADVRAGNSFTGDTFALHDGVGTLTHIGVTCALSFTQQPSDALKGPAVITPAITVTGSPASLFNGDSIDLAIADDSPTTATLGGDTSQNANPSGVATFNDISLPASGDYKLVATSGGASSDSSDTFTISDGNIDCGQTVSTDNDGVVTQTVEVTQLNVPGCSLKPYILTHNGESVQFLYPMGQASSAFTIRVNAFAPEPVPPGPVPMSTVDVKFDGNGDLITLVHPIEWCLTDANGDPVLPGDEATCLLSQSTVTLATDQIQVSESYFLKGDLKFSRGG